MKISTKSATGTSFFDSTIRASVNDLIAILGEPSDDSNTGQDKVNIEWTCELKNGDVFTIYDWKLYRPINIKDNEIVQWHIGANSMSISNKARLELLSAISELAA